MVVVQIISILYRKGMRNMNFKTYLLLFILFYFQNFAIATEQEVTNACLIPPGTPRKNGFRVKFQKYIFPEYHKKQGPLEYLTKYHYQFEGNFIVTTSVVTDIKLEFIENVYNGPYMCEVFGVPITISNFTLDLTGYFVTKLTGKHTLKLTKTDDTALLMFSNPSAFICCQTDEKLPQDITDISINAVFQYSTNIPSTVTLNLMANVPYPMRLLYYNLGRIGRLDFSFTDPKGRVHSKYDGYVFLY